MLTLRAHQFDADDCDRQLKELEDFLQSNPEIRETGENGLQQFFSQRPNLILLLGFWSFGLEPSLYKAEVSLPGNEFRADFVVANRSRSKFMFIEFEDATEKSIFRPKRQSRRSGNMSFEWSPRYEHGLSQVIDWHYRMDDYERTHQFEEYFGSRHISYTGLLVIGRDQSIERYGLVKRFRWRAEKTVVNSKQIHCITFDQLLQESKEKLLTIRASSYIE